MATLLVVALICAFQAVSEYLYEDELDEGWYIYFSSLIFVGVIILWLC